MRIDEAVKVLSFGTRKITYTLHRRDRKRLRIVVAPETASEVQIEAALMKKAA